MVILHTDECAPARSLHAHYKLYQTVVRLMLCQPLGARLKYTISKHCRPNVVNIFHSLSQCWALHQD